MGMAFVGAAVWRLASTDVTLAHPGVDVAPTMTLGLLITLLVAVLPAVLTPLPAQPHRQVATREPVPELEDVAA